MKKIYLFIFFIYSVLSGYSQTTATNFNCNDCSGKNHDLFAELNSGKVIVIDWVMPCSSCLGPSKTAYNIAQSYASSNPGKVFLYICDDYANTNCTSLSSWVDQNGMSNAVKFSNASIKMSDYGSDGMPKIVIIGGKDHTIFFNEINTASGNSGKLQAGINSAIAASNSIEGKLASASTITLSPNPAANSAIVALDLINPAEITMELYNALGQKMMTILDHEKLVQGNNEVSISTQNITNGIYFVKVSDSFGTKVIKLVVSH